MHVTRSPLYEILLVLYSPESFVHFIELGIPTSKIRVLNA